MGFITNLEQFTSNEEIVTSEPPVASKPRVRKKAKVEVPIWEKSNLTLEEAAAYSGIGINKLRDITNAKGCDFVIFIGTKRLIKRRKLDEYTDKITVL